MRINNKRNRLIESIVKQTIKQILKESDGEDNANGITWDYDQKVRTKYVDGRLMSRDEFWVNINVNDEQAKKISSKLKGSTNLAINGNRIGICFTKINEIFKPDGSVNIGDKAVFGLRRIIAMINGRVDDDLLNDMLQGLSDYATKLKESIEIAYKSSDELWNKLLENFESEEIQAMLKKITIEALDDELIDHQYSFENKIKALAQGQVLGVNVTYLKTKKQWLERGRVVNNGATPIWLVAGFGKLDKERYAQNLAKKNVSSSTELSHSESHAIDIDARDKQGYKWYPYYDISQTTPTDNDVWDKEIGFKDNLNGIPNDYTIGASNSGVAASDELKQALAIDNGTNGNHMKIVQALSVLVKDNGINPKSPSSDDENACSLAANSMIKELVVKLLPKQLNLIKKTSPEFIQIADRITIMLMCSFGFTPKISSFSAVPSEAKGMRLVFCSIYDKVNKILRGGTSNIQSESLISSALQSYIITEELGSMDGNQVFMDLYAKFTGEDYYEEDGYDNGEIQ